MSAQRDKDGVLFVRKAIIRCGIACNLNGRWEVGQLYPHLQNIVSNYGDNFDGVPVSDSISIDGDATDSQSE